MTSSVSDYREKIHFFFFSTDFDPFFETQKGLAELIENEQQQTQSNQSSKLLDNSTQRCRLPPPGFSHMNAFGLGVPRAPTQTSKILPFMNNGGNASQSQQSHNWQHHSGQPQQNLNYGIHDQMSNLLSKQNHQANKNSTYPGRSQRIIEFEVKFDMLKMAFVFHCRLRQHTGLESNGSSYSIIPPVSIVYVWAAATAAAISK